tara:strand:+ start:2039 stop:2365 length:327 start_codon:yes stop_codon:yes gene_type:complete
MSFILVYTTCSSEDEAALIADNLLREGLVACANIIPSMVSLYRWEDKIVQDRECIVLLKTIEKNFNSIEKIIIELHSFDRPCIICIPISEINNEFGKWIKDLTEGIGS